MKLRFKNILKKTPFAYYLIIGVMVFTSCITGSGSPSDPDVILTENAETYTLDNGILTAKIAKASGDLVSLRYKDKEMLATFLTPEGEPDLQRDPPGANPNGLNKGMTDHQYGFWSHDAMGPKDTEPAIASVTIDPESNGGKRVEISIKGISNGRKMGTGPGSNSEGQLVSDIDIRYSLGKGESGIYTYCIFNHKPEYAFTMLGEARFAAKLADFFDWMSVDAERNFHFPKTLHEGDKYIYTALQSENPAFGWSSTTEKVGLFFINASMEYMSGGPTKVEFLGHRDTNPVAAPTILNYWRSSHYGGAEVNVAEGENWSKIVGPFMIYVNSGSGPEDIYNDAKSQVGKEKEKWPYSWVDNREYPTAKERGTVKGQIVLNDEGTDTHISNLMVGLTAPAYTSPQLSNKDSAPVVDWQRDAKFYQFWTKGNADDGSFEIAKVRPGKYTLHAMADGVLGEFIAEGVTVKTGESLNLGKLEWKPVRYGKQLWDVGIPNRTITEFFKADEYNDPWSSIKYVDLFPNDVNYTIGESDYAKDWFFKHIPHLEDPDAQPSPYRGVNAPGRATPYTIIFNLPSAPQGKAILRLAICGTGTKSLDIEVNGKKAGTVDNLKGDSVIPRHGKQGIWYERELSFGADLMQQGKNTLVLTVPAGSVNNGIMYDYIRLELDDSQL